MSVTSALSKAIRSTSALAIAAGLCSAVTATATPYRNQVLTDNICCEESHTDPRLVKAWGVTFDPTGFAWVAAHFTGRAELLDGNGAPQPLSVRLEVPPLFNGGFVTGLTFNPGDDFLVANGTAELAPARFLFVTLDGTILGWAPRPAPLPQNTFAPIILNNFNRGDYYTGTALVQTDEGSRLLIADFFHRTIQALDGTFAPVNMPLTDPNLPAGFTPYNVRVLDGRIYVAYARENSSRDDVIPGPGSGIINTFKVDGTFDARLITGGRLNAPWGMALAPANFGEFSNALVVGNVGDGRINAYNPSTGAFLGSLRDDTGSQLSIDGLHGIEFGNGQPTQATNTLYYGASPSFGAVGVFGRIDAGCRSDITSDGQINTADLTLLLSKFGQNVQPNNPIDINADGVINTSDLAALLAAFGQPCQ